MNCTVWLRGRTATLRSGRGRNAAAARFVDGIVHEVIPFVEERVLGLYRSSKNTSLSSSKMKKKKKKNDDGKNGGGAGGGGGEGDIAVHDE